MSSIGRRYRLYTFLSSYHDTVHAIQKKNHHLRPPTSYLLQTYIIINTRWRERCTADAIAKQCCSNGKGYGCNYFSSERTNTGSAETTESPSVKIIIILLLLRRLHNRLSSTLRSRPQSVTMCFTFEYFSRISD